MTRRLLQLATAWVLLSSVTSAPYGQTSQSFPDDPFNQPLTDPDVVEGAKAPQLRFRLMEEFPLPGPLPGSPPRLVDGKVELPVDGGVAIWSGENGAPPRIEPPVEGGEADAVEWTVSRDGSRRYRTLPNGFVLCQKRCKRCDDGWKKRWRLRLPGNTLTRPVLDDRMLYFGAMDNRIYGVKSRNGHRVWTTEVEGRPARPLVLWRGGVGGPVNTTTGLKMTLVLVVLDNGAQLLAFDGFSGKRAARIQLPPDEGSLVSVPLILPDGRIAIAHQRYNEAEASLMVYRLDDPIIPPPGVGSPPPSDVRERAETAAATASGP